MINAQESATQELETPTSRVQRWHFIINFTSSECSSWTD